MNDNTARGCCRVELGQFSGTVVGGIGAPVTADDLVVGNVTEVRTFDNGIEIEFEIKPEFAHLLTGETIGDVSLDKE